MKCFQVDAFADRPFAGNPAAVCLLEEARGESWMQAVAMEMALSETAFLLREGEGYRLRWFTPTSEVELCGHATLASAHILWQEGLISPEQEARFFSLSGLLEARLEGGWICLDFPAIEYSPVEPPEALLASLGGIQPVYSAKTRFDYLFEVSSEEEVRGLSPDFGAMKQSEGARGVMVTAASTREGVDFVSRLFAPGVGIDEDPVTGSAHCSLGPYWGEKLGKDELLGFQASARGGYVRVKCKGPRVELWGQAVTTLAGELLC